MVALDSQIWNKPHSVTSKALPELFSTMTRAAIDDPVTIESDGSTIRSTIEVLGTVVGSEVVGATVVVAAVVVVVATVVVVVAAIVVVTEMWCSENGTACGPHPVSRTVVPATRMQSLREFPTAPTDPRL